MNQYIERAESLAGQQIVLEWIKTLSLAWVALTLGIFLIAYARAKLRE